MTEKEKFNKWLEKEKEKGLIDIKLHPINKKNIDSEEVYADLNKMNDAYAKGNYTVITEL